MKQYLSRQLWMLAILLFAGIGNAFGYKITTTIDGIPYGSGGVQYEIDGVTTWVEKSDVREINPNAVVFLYVQSLNSVYAIKKVEIDGNDITANYINGDLLIYDFGVLDKDYTVNVVFEKRTDVEIVNFTISWNTDVLPKLEYHFEPGWTFANPGEVCELVKGTYYLYFDNLSSVYSITSIKVDDQDVTGDYNENKKCIQVEADNDHDIAIEIAKTPTNTITVNWNYTDNVEVFFASNVGPDIVAVSETPCELIKGEDYWMHIYIPNSILYDITSIMVDNVNVTNDFLSNGVISFPNLTDDHEVNIVIAKAENTKNITVNWDQKKGEVRFHDTSDHKYVSAQAVTELREGSTVKMQIMPNEGWKLETLKVDGTDVTNTYNANNYYEFADLSDNHSVNVVFAEVTTYTITPIYDDNLTWVNFSDGIMTYGVSSGISKKFNAGSNVTMIMPVNSLYSTTISVDEGAYFTPDINNTLYEYVFDDGNLGKDHIVNVQLTEKPKKTITVDYNSNEAEVHFTYLSNWNSISPNSSGVEWELPVGDGSSYRMVIDIPNSWVYSLGSVMLDETNDITNTIINQGYYAFENLSADHTVTIVVNKEVAKTQTIKVNYDNSYSYVEFYNPQDYNYMYANNGVATELPSGSTIRLMINLQLGWKVKTLKVDGEEVAFNGSYYEFTNLSADHIVDIEYETAETHTITVAYDTEYINRVNLNGSRVSNNVYKFNEGSDAKMTIYCKDGYKPVLTIDNGDPVTPDKIRNGQYEYVFSNLSADHNVNIAYTPITYHSITVNYDYSDYIDARLNTAQNSYNWITSGVSNQFEDGDVVTLVLNISSGYALTSLKVGDTDINGAYDENGNYTYTFAPLSSDLVVDATIGIVESYYINAWFNQGSQGTIYMESVMTGRIETTGRSFNKGSDVTLIVEPAIGYEVSKIILGENNSNKAPEEVNFTEEDGLYKFTISALSNSYYVEITTQKKSMTGSELFTLDDAGMCTYCSEKDLDFTNVSGITAYIATGFNPATGSVVLTRVEKVLAGTGLLIKGKPGNYSIPVVETNCYNMNMLTGIVKPREIPSSVWTGIEYTNYILQSDGVFRIVNYSNNQLDAHKAYLHIPTNLVPAKAESRILIEWGAPKGDVNGDGVVDIADAVRIVNFIVGKIGN